MKKFLAGIGVALLAVAIAAGAYYLGQSRVRPLPSPSPNPQTQTNNTPRSKTAAPALPSPSALTQNQSQIRDNIIASIVSQNTAALEGYMTNPVSVRLEASECCGQLTPVEAVAELDYISPGTNWDFSPSNPIIQQLNAQVPQYYGPNHIVGIASNGFVVSFQLNQNSQISAISMSAHYDLLISP